MFNIKITFFSIFLIILISCERSNEPTDKNKNIDSNATDRRKIDLSSIKEDEHPFTKNPIKLKIIGYKIYFDSLAPYFINRDIERLDLLCGESLIRLDSLPTVDFSTKEFKTKFQVDTFNLYDYQFLVGNLKTNPGYANVLIFINYLEAWGNDIFLVSIDKNNNIIDIIDFCSSSGDGGDFNDTKVEFINKYRYSFENKKGYQSFSEPIDTIKYTKTSGHFIINSDGSFQREIIRIDSNIVETFKSNND